MLIKKESGKKGEKRGGFISYLKDYLLSIVHYLLFAIHYLLFAINSLIFKASYVKWCYKAKFHFVKWL